MGQNLVIDQGNSAAKVAIFRGPALVRSWRYEELTPRILTDIAADYDITAAIYCSVSRHGEDIVVTLRGIAPRVYELTSMLPLPIKIGYTTPTTLGRDRIAAIAGAWACYPGRSVLVVDAGTAVTYDVLDTDGTFIGGNIAPGLWMRAQALHDMTSRLPLVDVESEHNVALWGTDTEGAIMSGVVRGVAGEIAYYRSQLPDDTIVMLTGGDAVRLAPLIDGNVEIDSLLVCKGLNSILTYNESR